MKILELRKQKKLTQQNIADFLGISQRAYANYENNKNEPNITTLIKLANYYNVSLDYLLERDFQGGLTTDEYELISIYRDLKEDEQKRLLGFAKFSHSLNENLKKEIK
mgnify:CR=1 FL=1